MILSKHLLDTKRCLCRPTWWLKNNVWGHSETTLTRFCTLFDPPTRPYFWYLFIDSLWTTTYPPPLFCQRSFWMDSFVWVHRFTSYRNTYNCQLGKKIMNHLCLFVWSLILPRFKVNWEKWKIWKLVVEHWVLSC